MKAFKNSRQIIRQLRRRRVISRWRLLGLLSRSEASPLRRNVYLITMTLEAIKWKNGKLQILDQLLLPKESTYIDISGVEDGWNAIHKMQVCLLDLL